MLTVQDVLASEKLTKIVMMSISNELADKGVSDDEIFKVLTGATEQHQKILAQKFDEHTYFLSELYVSPGAGVVKN